MNVGDMCSRAVVSISAYEPVQQAAELMRRYQVGTLVVTQPASGGDEPIGVITDRDIVIGVVAKHVEPDTLTAGDVMSAEPLIAEEHDDVNDVLDDMRREGVRRIPVVDQAGTLVGVFALDDLLQILATQLNLVAGIVGSQRTEERRKRA
ncbi:MAG: CBS domain-containing protein [Gammaproteobacteria bacterium]